MVETMKQKDGLDEYFRRDLLHTKSVGVCAGIEYIMCRLAETKRPANWLIQTLNKEHKKAYDVAREMALHREEYRKYADNMLRKKGFLK
jgi:hypothetical protein